MLRSNDGEMLLWLALALAGVAGIARGFWLYRASLTWPTADGAITRLDVERKTGTSLVWGDGAYQGQTEVMITWLLNGERHINKKCVSVNRWSVLPNL
jgi:hypothetical protein